MLPLERERLTVSFTSFGFKHGPLRDADLIFDVRFLPNPHYIDELRPLTGRDDAGRRVRRAATASSTSSTSACTRCSTSSCPQYLLEGKAHLTIAIGCTGGRHRWWRSPSTSPGATRGATGSRSTSSTATSSCRGDSIARRRRRARITGVLDHVGFEVTDLELRALLRRRLLRARHPPRPPVAEPRSPTATTGRRSGSSSGAGGRSPATATSPCSATGKAAVEAAHAAGVSNGGADDGAARPRPHYGQPYFAAYLRDPDGLRVEVVSGSRR